VIENSTSLVLEEIALDQLKPHPRNYRSHPEDEIEHLVESIHANGIYRNIVIASEGTILAGRGVAIAARRAGYSTAPVYRAPFGPDDPRALKLLIADNEISHLAENDDRLLTELLRELKESEVGLLGTDYDDMMLANLVFVTRPASEIADLDAATQWVGLPEYDEGQDHIQIMINFACEEDCQAFCRMLNLGMGKTAVKGAKKSFWWPVRGNDDNTSILFSSVKKEEIGEA
jgi:hypothetical protein